MQFFGYKIIFPHILSCPQNCHQPHTFNAVNYRRFSITIM